MGSEVSQDNGENKQQWLVDDFWANGEFADRAIKAARELDSDRDWISLEDLKKERVARREAGRVEGAKSPTIR